MAQFRASIQGTRGQASRLGTKSSGLMVAANGWDTGVRVHIAHKDGKDVVTIYRTGGSNNGANKELVGTWEQGAPTESPFVNACRSVLEWAKTPGDHGGNPYCKPFVRLAREALGDWDA